MSGLKERLDELTGMSEKASKARADREYLEEFKKSKLAILMKQAELEGHKTVAAQEREARANEEYINLLHGLRVATEECEKLEWRLRIALKGADLYKTEQINEMAERKLYGR